MACRDSQLFSVMMKTKIQTDSSGRIFRNQKKKKMCLPGFSLQFYQSLSLSITCYVPGANNMKSIPNEQ